MVSVIIGAGGHAQDIAAWTGYSMIDNHFVASWMTKGRMVIGVNDPHVRSEIAAHLEDLGWVPADARVHHTASLGRSWTLGEGVIVGPLASLLANVHLGRHVHVGAGCHLTRCTVGDFTTISPGATVCGDVTIGARCLIGAGAVVKNLVSVGDDVTVGAGAVVVNDIPNGVTVKGVPAR